MSNAIVGQLPARVAQSSRYIRRMVPRSALLFGLALFGYPVIGGAISLLQVDSRALSVPFRIAVALFSVWMILTTRPLKMDGLRRVMLIIWCLYVLRLLHDWLIPDLQGADYALQFFIASAVLPGFALMKAQVFEWRRFALIGFAIATSGALLGLFAGLFGSADVQDGGVAGRLSLAAVNPVSLGNQATSAILCGLVLWRDARIHHRAFLLCLFMLLLACLMLTGSKGPVLQLLICGALWAFRRGFAWRMGLGALPLLAWMFLSTSNPLADRLAGTGDDSSTAERVVMISDSFDQIADSPLIGSAFVELNSGFYPHNVFVEAGLAFGVPVALVFAGMIIVGAGRAWKTLKTDYDLLGLLYIQGLLDATFAGSIYGMQQLWVLLAILPTAAILGARRRQRAPMPAPPSLIPMGLEKP
jgi:O-antigen ligase